MKKLIIALVAVLGVGAVTPASALAAPTCGFAWTQIAQGAFDVLPNEVLSNVTTEQAACMDVMTLQFLGLSSGYTVQYVNEVTDVTTGEVVPLQGNAKLQVTLRAPGYDAAGNEIFPGNSGDPIPGVDLTGYEVFRDAKFAGRSANVIRFGLGVRERVDFRVIKGLDRVVVRVSHL